MAYCSFSSNYFNPRSLAGATTLRGRRLINHNLFQSTLPRGSDRRLRSPYSPQHNFNPRSLAGATGEAAKERYEGIISIHAPSRERRYNHMAKAAPAWEFQSTLPRGSDALLTAFLLSISISIHAPSRERPRL